MWNSALDLLLCSSLELPTSGRVWWSSWRRTASSLRAGSPPHGPTLLSQRWASPDLRPEEGSPTPAWTTWRTPPASWAPRWRGECWRWHLRQEFIHYYLEFAEIENISLNKIRLESLLSRDCVSGWKKTEDGEGNGHCSSGDNRSGGEVKSWLPLGWSWN